MLVIAARGAAAGAGQKVNIHVVEANCCPIYVLSLDDTEL